METIPSKGLVMAINNYGSFIMSEKLTIQDGCITPSFQLRKARTSGFLKYFHEYEGHEAVITIQILPKEPTHAN